MRTEVALRNFRKNVILVLREKKISQSFLADLCGITPAAVTMILHPKDQTSGPNLRTALRISQALNVPLGLLLGEVEVSDPWGGGTGERR